MEAAQTWQSKAASMVTLAELGKQPHEEPKAPRGVTTPKKLWILQCPDLKNLDSEYAIFKQAKSKRTPKVVAWIEQA